MARRSFTLIELLVICGLITSAVLGYHYLARFFSPQWGGLLGAMCGGFAFVALFVMWLMLYARLFDGTPYLPTCRNGFCRSQDYRVERVQGRVCWRCGCGDLYDRVGRRFVGLDGDSETPYLTWHPIHGWQPDQQA